MWRGKWKRGHEAQVSPPVKLPYSSPQVYANLAAIASPLRSLLPSNLASLSPALLPHRIGYRAFTSRDRSVFGSALQYVMRRTKQSFKNRSFRIRKESKGGLYSGSVRRCR